MLSDDDKEQLGRQTTSRTPRGDGSNEPDNRQEIRDAASQCQQADARSDCRREQKGGTTGPRDGSEKKKEEQKRREEVFRGDQIRRQERSGEEREPRGGAERGRVTPEPPRKRRPKEAGENSESEVDELGRKQIVGRSEMQRE